MSKTKFQIHRSMFVQIVLLTILVGSAAVYQYAFRPYLDFLEEIDSNSTPLEQTVMRLRGEINEILRVDDPTERAAAFDGSDVIAGVSAANPDMYFKFLREGRLLEYGTATTRYQQILNTIPTEFDLESEATQCSMFRDRNFDPAKGEQFDVSMGYCSDTISYSEVSGVSLAVPSVYAPSIWSILDTTSLRTRQNLIVVGSVFLAFIAILSYNLWLLWRVAKVANAVRPDNLLVRLPEAGLPSEVKPLVSAVNNMIEKVNQANEREKFFLSMAAHEIRTPLAALRTRLEIMEENNAKPSLIEDVNRLSNLVNQLLRLMRIRDHSKQFSVVDLVDLTHEVIQTRLEYASEQGVKICLKSDLAKYETAGDRNLIIVAISNLIDNAVSFTPPGQSVVVTIDETGCLTVRDHGPGISPQLSNNLYEPFAKFPPNRKGHGLGLAIVVAVANLHGAQLSGNNLPDGGALFSLNFSEVHVKDTF